MLNTIKTLCALPGVSSREDEVRDYLIREASPYAEKIQIDAMGSLLIWKKGKKAAGHKLMLCAHMDEVGLMVRQITEEGFLKFDTVGGVDRRILIGKQVYVGKNRIPGVIGLKAYHLVLAEEEKKIPKLDEFYIDIGTTDRESAEKLISVGDFAVFVGEPVEFGDKMLKAKALDDRIGCAVMLKLLREELPMDCIFAFTVQEEVGTRGAFGAAYSVTPEIALVLEATTAADSPSMADHKKVCSPGKGPVIPFMDGGSVYDREFFKLLRDLAEQNGIPWQTKHYLSGGTDASAIQRSKEGVRVCAVSAAVRYLHAPSSVGSIRDFEQIYTLVKAFIGAVADRFE